MPKVIQYYTKNNYGQTFEYVVGKDAALIQQLTGKKTIDSKTRAIILDLCGGSVTFERVFEPA